VYTDTQVGELNVGRLSTSPVKRKHLIIAVIGSQAAAMLILALIARAIANSSNGVGVAAFAFAYAIPALTALCVYARGALAPSLSIRHRIARMLGAVFLTLVGHIMAVAALQFINLGSHSFALRHRFPIEIRDASSTGAVTFIPQNYDDWRHGHIASAAWQQGGLYVRHVVYSRGAMFTFTTSGLVLILEGAENGDPYNWSDWSWGVGNPHDFRFPESWYGDS
jgi:hypothetical protein